MSLDYPVAHLQQIVLDCPAAYALGDSHVFCSLAVTSSMDLLPAVAFAQMT